MIKYFPTAWKNYKTLSNFHLERSNLGICHLLFHYTWLFSPQIVCTLSVLFWASPIAFLPLIRLLSLSGLYLILWHAKQFPSQDVLKSSPGLKYCDSLITGASDGRLKIKLETSISMYQKSTARRRYVLPFKINLMNEITFLAFRKYRRDDLLVLWVR